MRRVVIWMCAAALVGCGGGDGGTPTDAGPDVDADTEPSFEVATGTIAVTEAVLRTEEGDYGFNQAFAAIGTEAPPLFQTETMRSGACRLLQLEPAFCSDPCDGICAGDDVCVPFPSYAAAGTITITGLTTELTLTAKAPYNYYNPTDYPLPEDLFAAGDTITATASGATIPAFSVTATGVADLEPGFEGENLTLEDGGDVVVTWTPAGGGARVRLTLNSTNAGHGLPLDTIIECDTTDTGSVTVPRAMVEAFPEAFGSLICVGVDCPPSSLRRYTRQTTTAGDAEVELRVASEVSFGVNHAAAVR